MIDGQAVAFGKSAGPLTFPLSAGSAYTSCVQVASLAERETWERWENEDVQHVSGVTAAPVPRHCMITTGYSWLRPPMPYGSLALPALGWAPFQLISTRSRPRRFLVW